MHVVQHPTRQRVQRRMYSPSERVVVNGVGLGSLEGFNIGKMFSRMVHITPRSFQPKNIFGAMASATSFVVSAGMSSVLAPKLFSAHSKTMQTAGTVMAAVGAGAAGAALLPAGTLTSAAGFLAKGGTGLLSTVTKMFGGKGGGSAPQQTVQEQYGPQQPVAQQIDPAAQAAYDAQVAAYYRQQQAVENQLTPTVFPTMANPNANYSAQPVTPDTYLQSPSSPYIDTTVPIDPATGLPIQQAGMFPELSKSTWLVIGGLVLGTGMYLTFSDEKK